MATLLNQKLLKSCVEKFNFPENQKRQRIDEIISAWQTAFKDHDLSKAKETSLQGKFFSKFFCEILGYTMQDDGQEVWTLKQEAKTEVDGKEADGSLGYYSKISAKTRCVIELKDAQCNLDSKQQSRESKQTPVEQAFQYLYKFADCDWVIVSNFRYTRLYHKSKGQTAYEEFDILNLHEEKEFKRFYYCLCKENLLNENSCSQMDLLIKQSGEADIDITKEFYAEFKTVRKILFEHIVENNPDFDKKLLLEKTQKLLDRFIFIFFCEDTAGLLPHNTVENIYKMAQNSFSLSECKIWEQFRGLFVAIDKGNNNVNPPINAYNGGLFAYDEILDKLIIKDEMFTHIKELARYDFESDLNVNILGHIFEQSLSDLEQIKNELDGIQEDKKNSKRKKDGIFYTPEYITHYIVEETIGKYLEENPNKLETIKILDPACGSGAFLNQAHSFLLKQRQIQVEENIKNNDKSQLNLFKHTNQAEHDRSILLNNLFGVDLNKESVEITKLALWLKTANSKCKLNNLDENIKCGNSLIDEEFVAGDKAFKWETEYKDIMQNGGFDVIIGNPPYVFTRMQEYDDNLKNFFELCLLRCGIEKVNKGNNIQSGKLNLYTWFLVRSLGLLKENGILGFIIPNGILRTTTYDIIRKYLIENTKILKIIDLGSGVFEGVTTSTIIIILQKTSNKELIANNNTNIIINVSELLASQYTQYLIAQKDFLSNISYTFNIYVNDKKQLLNKKLQDNCEYLGKICKHISPGIDGNKEKYVEKYKKDDKYKPLLYGKNVNKYVINFDSNYICYDRKLLNRAREEQIFLSKKIILQRISGGTSPISACIDNNCYYTFNSVNNIVLLDNCNFKLGYILALINSRLIKWYYANNFSNNSTLTVNISKTI